MKLAGFLWYNKKNNTAGVDADGAITLTESGMEIARTMYTRHTVLSEMLMRLGVDEKTATEDACRIEHVISEESFLAVKKHLEWSVAQSVKGQRDSVE